MHPTTEIVSAEMKKYSINASDEPSIIDAVRKAVSEMQKLEGEEIRLECPRMPDGTNKLLKKIFQEEA